MRIDLDHLRVFCIVAQEGSFTAAAAVMHISQPSVSRTIQILEERLGYELFERTPRGIKLTPRGDKIFRHSRRLSKRQTFF